MLQMVHPDRVVSEAELDKLPMVEPVYPLTEGLTLNPVRKAAEAALTKIPKLPEWQDAGLAAARGLPVVRRRAANPASPGRARRHPAGGQGLVAARL